MEEDGGGCGNDDNNACVAYDNRANGNATKTSGAFKVVAIFRRNQQSNWTLAWRGGGRMCK
jgi:hypothetical protein